MLSSLACAKDKESTCFNRVRKWIESSTDSNQIKATMDSIPEDFDLDSHNTGDILAAASNNEKNEIVAINVGRLEELKRREAELMELLEHLKKEKAKEVNSHPLTIGVVGFGTFGQFLSKAFVKHAKVIGTSRSDYTKVAKEIGASYVPLSKSERFLSQVDVVLFAVAIKSFKSTVEKMVPSISLDMERRRKEGQQGILFVDVCSVKEYPRRVMLDLLPPEADILCCHPMFGPISGANGWTNLRFIYEKTRVNMELLEHPDGREIKGTRPALSRVMRMTVRSIALTSRSDAEESDARKKGMDRMERFLSIWEEEGCAMKAMSCTDHDMYAAKSQFITHLMGRVLGQQGLEPTPVDTKGFESILSLVKSTTSDSYDLFYGLYHYNSYSSDIMIDLRKALDEVEKRLRDTELDVYDC